MTINNVLLKFSDPFASERKAANKYAPYSLSLSLFQHSASVILE